MSRVDRRNAPDRAAAFSLRDGDTSRGSEINVSEQNEYSICMENGTQGPRMRDFAISIYLLPGTNVSCNGTNGTNVLFPDWNGAIMPGSCIEQAEKSPGGIRHFGSVVARNG
jgi:hypothetical protein